MFADAEIKEYKPLLRELKRSRRRLVLIKITVSGFLIGSAD
jgi:hypothetical protein